MCVCVSLLNPVFKQLIRTADKLSLKRHIYLPTRLSIFRAQNMEKLQQVVRRWGTCGPLCCSEKLDGISVSMLFRDGRLVQALTRGDGKSSWEEQCDASQFLEKQYFAFFSLSAQQTRDILNTNNITLLHLHSLFHFLTGTVGEVITHSVARMRGVPGPETLGAFSGHVRGEIMCRKSVMAAHFPDGKSTRNIASGKARTQPENLSGDQALLDVYAFELIDPASHGLHTQSAVFAWLAARGFTTPAHHVLGAWPDFAPLWAAYQTRRSSLDYDIDGVVLQIDRLDGVAAGTTATSNTAPTSDDPSAHREKPKAIGAGGSYKKGAKSPAASSQEAESSAASTGNKHNNDLLADLQLDGSSASRWDAVAFKFPSLTAETRLKAIEYAAGRTGRIIPVAVFEPVVLSSASLQRASLASCGRVRRLWPAHAPPAEDDMLVVSRRADVIPHVEMVLPLSAPAADGYPTKSAGKPKQATPAAAAEAESRAAPRKTFPLPTACPTCGSALVWKGEHLECPSSQCGGAVQRRLAAWLAETGAHSWGSKVVEALVEQQLAASPLDVYRLSAETLAGLQLSNRALGTAVATKMLDQLAQTRQQPLRLEQLLLALAADGVGAAAIRKLISSPGERRKKKKN